MRMRPSKLQRMVSMCKQIERHGQNLLRLFPNAVEKEPVALYEKIRRIERRASRIGLRVCNGPEYASEEELDQDRERIYKALRKLLGQTDVPIRINQDPRGYSLKIDENYMRAHQGCLHSDWGGYGILAPDFTGE